MPDTHGPVQQAIQEFNKSLLSQPGGTCHHGEKRRQPFGMNFHSINHFFNSFKKLDSFSYLKIDFRICKKGLVFGTFAINMFVWD